MTTKFSEMRRPMTPKRRAHIDAIKAEMEAAEGMMRYRTARFTCESCSDLVYVPYIGKRPRLRVIHDTPRHRIEDVALDT